MKKLSVVFFMVLSAFILRAQEEEVPVDSLETTLEKLHRVDYPVFQPGERIEYLVHYGIVDAGTAVVEVKKDPVKMKGRDAYHVVGKGNSVGAFNWFFKVRDTYESYIDAEDVHPYLFLRDVNEGGYSKQQNYVFEQDSNKVHTNKGQTAYVPEGVQDMISAFYFARTLDFSKYKENEVVTIQTFVDGKIEPVKMRYVGREEIKTKAGKFKCLKFNPIVQPDRIFKNPDDLIVYVTDDKNKVPVLAKAKILVGSIKMQLTGYENLMHPVARLD